MSTTGYVIVGLIALAVLLVVIRRGRRKRHDKLVDRHDQLSTSLVRLRSRISNELNVIDTSRATTQANDIGRDLSGELSRDNLDEAERRLTELRQYIDRYAVPAELPPPPREVRMRKPAVPPALRNPRRGDTPLTAPPTRRPRPGGSGGGGGDDGHIGGIYVPDPDVSDRHGGGWGHGNGAVHHDSGYGHGGYGSHDSGGSGGSDGGGGGGGGGD